MEGESVKIMDFHGWCEVNREGVLFLYKEHGNDVPLIKRVAQKLITGKTPKIQYGNAFNLHKRLNIPLDKIIVIP